MVATTTKGILTIKIKGALSRNNILTTTLVAIREMIMVTASVIPITIKAIIYANNILETIIWTVKEIQI